MKYVLLILLLLSSATATEARPVSYPGGWTMMLMNDKDTNSSHIHYSPSAKYSVGWKHEYMRDSKANADYIQLNNLLKRWNKPYEQANFYLKSGAGFAYDDGEFEPAAFTGIALDWETRRYFTSYENHLLYAGDIEKHIKHKARVGIAPYIGDYGDLHTWLMLQTDYDAGAEDSFSVTPLVRFFKDTSLVEAGYNFDEGIMVNFIQRF
jgi:hypothetical protein